MVYPHTHRQRARARRHASSEGARERGNEGARERGSEGARERGKERGQQGTWEHKELACVYGGREVLTMRKDAGQTAADCRSACVSGEEGGGITDKGCHQ